MKNNRARWSLAVLFVLLAGTLTVGPCTQDVAALDPHIVKGSVYEKNATDVWVTVTNATVTILNVRTSESTNQTANITGYYSYNLLNLPSGWAYGDTIQVTGYNATNASGVNSTQIALGKTNTTIDIYIGVTTAIGGVNFFVTDDDGYALEGALINIRDSNNDTVITKRTASTGKTSTNLSNGLYYITIAHKDFPDLFKVLRVDGSETFSFTMGEARVADDEALDLTWLLYLLAFVGILALLFFAFSKKGKSK